MIRVVDLQIPFSDGTTLPAKDISISAKAPLAIEDDGDGFVVPPGTSFQTCASTDGTRQGASALSTSPIVVRFDVPNNVLAVDGTFPMLLHDNNDGCTAAAFSVSGLISGLTPWQQVPAA